MTRFRIIRNTIKLIGSLDIKVFSICLLISSFVWLIMTMSDEFSQEMEIEVAYSEAPEGLILVNNPAKVITINVQGKGYRIASSGFGVNDPIKIDLSKIELRKTPFGRYVASIATKQFKNAIQSQLNISVLGSDFKPDSLYFVFDSLVTFDIPIRISQNLSFEPGFTIVGSPQLNPASVKVSGPMVSLRKLLYINTDTLNYKDLSKDVITSIRLLNPDSLFTLATNEIEVKLDVEHFSDFESEVPITTICNIPGVKIKTFPAKVKLNYQMTLPDYKRLTDSSFQAIVSVDSTNILHQKRLIVKMAKAPENAKNIDIFPQTVEFILLKTK